jgi:fructose-1-phosphate kinase PfkB-like protein
LAAEGVEGRFAWASGETRSSLSVADRETGRLTEFYEAGTPVSEEEWRRLEIVVSDALPGAAWLALSGSLPVGAPIDGYAHLVLAARAAGVRVAVDARGEPLAEALGEGPELVKINEEEAGELLGHHVRGIDRARDAAREIRVRAGGEGHATVVTMGAEGTVLIDPDGAGWRGRPRVRGRYPVGSGDVFLGGLLTGLSRGESWQGALGVAIGAAAANAHIPGAGRLDPQWASQLGCAAEVRALPSRRLSG